MGEFGKHFRAARMAAGLKQTTAARLLGVTQSTISQYENDRVAPTLDTVVRMASVYGCSIDRLCGLEADGLIVKTIAKEG